MTNTTIRYNDQTLPYPTPLVSLERNNVYVNQYWGNSDKITLNGLITGNFDKIKTGQSGILSIFNQNFGNFEIYESIINPFTFTGTNNLAQITGVIIQDAKTGIPFPLEFDVNLNFIPTDVKLNLIKLSHTYYTDIKMALVSPNESGVFIPFTTPNFLDPGINLNILNYDLIFSKDSNAFFNGTQSGTFKTAATGTNIYQEGLAFPINLTGNKSISMDIFSNKNANGKWKLYVFDSIDGDSGIFSGAKLIFSNNEKIYENSGIVVQSISFEESPYSNLINYSIELNSSRLSGNVINPTNEYSFTENEDKTVSLSHSVSARGINTSKNPNKSNAMDNAIGFVKSNTGLANIPTVKFISGLTYRPFYMQNFSESIDRLNGVYSIQENYNTKTINSNLPGVLSYTCDITSGADSNVVQINLRGDYKGPKDGDIANLRNTLVISELFLYSGYYNPIPIQYNITENSGENLISFDYTFDNIDLPNPYFKYDANITKDELQQIYNIQVRGDVIARGSAPYRYYLSTGNLVNLTGGFIKVASGILTGFKNFNSDTSSSNLRLLNISIDKNPNDSTVSANASYDDKYMPTGDFINANYSVSVEAPLWYMNNQPTCNVKGYHIINDFNITTLPKLSVSTSFTSKNVTGLNNESQLKQQARDITANIVPTNYNFNVKLQDSESLTKKYDNFNSLSQISYKLDKIDISNENGLLPKFNTI
jgi:subtilisin-like proprotein convertase family protein